MLMVNTEDRLATLRQYRIADSLLRRTRHKAPPFSFTPQIDPFFWYHTLFLSFCSLTGDLIFATQTGIGRTGKMWGYQNFDVEPDVVASAKVREMGWDGMS